MNLKETENRIKESVSSIVDTKDNNGFVLGLPNGVTDDFCYLNGVCTNKPDWKLPYVLVIGYRGVGKGVYAKYMSSLVKGVQYITAQSLNTVHATFRFHAEKIIYITEVEK